VLGAIFGRFRLKDLTCRGTVAGRRWERRGEMAGDAFDPDAAEGAKLPDPRRSANAGGKDLCSGAENGVGRWVDKPRGLGGRGPSQVAALGGRQGFGTAWESRRKGVRGLQPRSLCCLMLPGVRVGRGRRGRLTWEARGPGGPEDDLSGGWAVGAAPRRHQRDEPVAGGGRLKLGRKC